MSHATNQEIPILHPAMPGSPERASSSPDGPTPSGPGPRLQTSAFEDMPQSLAIPIAVHPVALITTECVSITSAMRKHGRLGQSSVSAILGGGSGKAREKSVPSPARKSQLAPEPKRSPRIADPAAPILRGGDHTLAGRWGLRGQRGKSQQDHPLLAGFAQLRSDLSGCADVQSFDAPALLHPFLQVIRSSSTSASITSLAVVAITKFFAYNLVTLESPRISLAMQLLSAAITHCRFEASDSSADEIVLLRILKLMESVLARPEGRLLGDESVCEIMETGLSMCCQSRLSEVLRRSAEMAMVSMCQVIFGRLKAVDRDSKGSGQDERPRASTQLPDVKMDPSVDGDSVVSPRTTKSEAVAPDAGAPEQSENGGAPESEATDGAQEGDNEIAEATPYSLPSIRELFRVLIDLLDPHNKQHTDTMRVIALRIIDVALEVAGPSIAKHSDLSKLAKNDLCRHLFQLIRSENMILLNGSLRVAGTLLQTCRDVLKLQQEVFLSYLVACLHPRVDIPQEPGIDPALYEGIPQAPKLVKPPPSQGSSGRSTPVPVRDRQKLGLEGGSRRPEARESMVESMGALVRIPTFMTELFVNYDCEVDRADLCEDMVGLLCRNAFPDSATWSTTNVPPLCLDALLGFVQSMAERLNRPPPRRDRVDLTRLRDQRERKKIIIRGATRFNEEPKAGIAYLSSRKIIDNPDDPLQVAHFLRGTARISKKVLGDFISKKSNERVLRAFIGLFAFDGKRIDEALRTLLGSFRLPGESQLIERIVTVFTERYCSSSASGAVEDKDAAFILTYGIIMLNTDLYNPNVKQQNRMSYTDFAKNLRGVNAGRDFDAEYLQAIYDSIKQDEIILPDEHDNKHSFDYAWKELLIKTATTGRLERCETNAYDGDMFEATWRPIVGTLCYVFLQASDDAVYSRVVNGFDQCAQIAARHGVVAALDRIVDSLCTISTLTTEKTTALNTEVQAGRKTVMVSELAVHFGRDFTAQLATVLLFRILRGNEGLLRDSWSQVVKIFLNLFVNSLIQFPPQGAGLIDLSPIPLQPPSQIIDRHGQMNESGILSAFTSYLSSYAAGDPPEPTDEELENTLCTVDCIKACNTDSVLANILALPAEVISHVVNLILAQLPDESLPIVVVKPDRPPSSPQPSAHPSSEHGTGYHPGMLFLLELATTLVLRDEATVVAAGESLTTRLQTLVRDATNLHPLVVVRVVNYLLRLLRSGYAHDFMRTPVVLHAISSFDDVTLNQTAESVASGLWQSISTADPLRNEIASSPDFWSVLQRLHRHKDQAQAVFDILEIIVQAEPPAISAENYEFGVSLANDFATAASVGAGPEPGKEPNSRRGRPQQRQTKPHDNAIIVRGTKGVFIIYQLTHRIPEFISRSHLERNEAWATYWSPIFRTLSTQCVNRCREVRHQALNHLQRCLLSRDLVSSSPSPKGKPGGVEDGVKEGGDQESGKTEWLAIFNEVLFPLLHFRLLKPEIYAVDRAGMGETRTQAATMLCKVFLHFLDRLDEHGSMLEVWLKVLDVLDRLMNSGQQIQPQQSDRRNGRAGGVGGDAGLLEEEVPESLKNCLLVMADAGFLVRPSEPESNPAHDRQQEQEQEQEQEQDDGHEHQNSSSRRRTRTMWDETRKRVQRFSPGLFDAVFPPPPTPPVDPSQKQPRQTPPGSAPEENKQEDEEGRGSGG